MSQILKRLHRGGGGSREGDASGGDKGKGKASSSKGKGKMMACNEASKLDCAMVGAVIPNFRAGLCLFLIRACVNYLKLELIRRLCIQRSASFLPYYWAVLRLPSCSEVGSCWIDVKTVDGKIIVSHIDEPYSFTIGKSELPKALEVGIGTMTRGEKAAIFLSKSYMTKSSLWSMIEGYDEIQFEVELVHFIQVRDMLGDGRLIKRRVVDGQGEFPMDCPLHDSLLRVHYKGMLLDEEKTVFYDTKVDNYGQPLEFKSGEGLVPEGLEMCVRLMLPGEIALVTSPPDYAYDKFSRPANVPEGAHVQWEIELLGFEMPKDWTGLTFQEIMDEAENIKNTGNRLFKEGKYELAKAKYEKVLREYNHVNPQDDEEGKIFLNSRNTLQLNVAACYQKMDEHRKSIETCNKVLDAGPAHVKALYRRGMAYMLLGDFVEAKKDFEMMMKVDKTAEPDAIAALLKLKQKEQETEKKARRQFKGLFDKKPGEISEVGNDVKDGSTPDDSKPETQNTMLEKETGDKDHIDGDAAESIYEPDRIGLLGRLWPSGSRIFAALGLNKCSIL
ncbi:peptidyl-prolyl cis-trans isomerase PASTICCINO1-like [Zingiber officinale]|uniref:peptidyl-prolyl cis-trans isomerase PASTICCINO1-like n=1 Tax=Zingiber officinale TaxID=94328 RepID=UPI001C4A9D9A|nr:peptidyl-prolyl cis-trans isomerase PASTICCINO1-like [Zingiber officinale]